MKNPLLSKTYAQASGKKTMNWYKVLNSKITVNKAYELSKLAGNWVTCACGNQCAIIPRNEDYSIYSKGMPKDKKLHDLGIQFSVAIDSLYEKINDNKIALIEKAKFRALKILDKIEKRSAILIIQELKKQTYAK